MRIKCVCCLFISRNWVYINVKIILIRLEFVKIKYFYKNHLRIWTIYTQIKKFVWIFHAEILVEIWNNPHVNSHGNPHGNCSFSLYWNIFKNGHQIWILKARRDLTCCCPHFFRSFPSYLVQMKNKKIHAEIHMVIQADSMWIVSNLHPNFCAKNP